MTGGAFGGDAETQHVGTESRPLDGFAHFQLLRPLFVTVEAPGDSAVTAEHGGGIERQSEQTPSADPIPIRKEF